MRRADIATFYAFASDDWSASPKPVHMYILILWKSFELHSAVETFSTANYHRKRICGIHMRGEDTYADLYLTVTLLLYATEDICHIASKYARAYSRKIHERYACM